MTTATHPHAYLVFLGLIQSAEKEGQIPSLEPDAKRLLEAIAVNHHEGHNITISDAMALGSIASPATIHRKLDGLREMGLVDTFYEGGNRRTKFLIPTEQAQKYFDTVRAYLLQACALSKAG